MGKQASAMIPVIKKLREGNFAPGEIVDFSAKELLEMIGRNYVTTGLGLRLQSSRSL